MVETLKDIPTIHLTQPPKILFIVLNSKETSMKSMSRIISLVTLMATIPLAHAGYSESLKSIDTPPSVTKQEFAEVKRKLEGQYAYAPNLKSQFVTVDGVRMHYVEGGHTGTPIVFVHGFGSTWKMWEPVMLAFAQKHKVVAIDLPGLGQSGPIANDDYSAENTSALLLKTIQKILPKSTKENSSIYYVSHDLANSASYPLVAKNQGYITKVVFMDSPIPSKDMFTYPGITPQGPGLGWHFGYFAFGDIAEKQIANDPSLFFSYFIKTYAGKKEIFTPKLLSELIEPYSTREKLHAAFGYYKSHAKSVAQNEKLLAENIKLHIPSMALTGEQGVNDVLTKEMAARFVTDKNNFTATILPGCGHWMVEECAPQVIDSLTSFFDEKK